MKKKLLLLVVCVLVLSVMVFAEDVLIYKLTSRKQIARMSSGMGLSGIGRSTAAAWSATTPPIRTPMPFRS